MPGCQVMLAKDGQVVLDESYGRLGLSDSNEDYDVNGETLYDLASMSKVCGTLAALMKTYDMGMWKLTDPLSKYLPEIDSLPLGRVTMQDLLYHQSGLPPSINVYSAVLDTATYVGNPIRNQYGVPYTEKIYEGVYGQSGTRLRPDVYSAEHTDIYHMKVAEGIYASDSARTLILDAIYDTPLSRRGYCYSDLNFCLLMEVQERITGVPHDVWVYDNVYFPLGMDATGYCPTEFYPIENIAPTEVDTYLRRQHVHGTVHDETAAFSGGVQGNAGLFSNTSDLIKLLQCWANGGEYGGVRLYSEDTVKKFITSKSPISDRGLGFDRLTGKKSWGVSPLTYGHTGFTGTCFWIDPEKGLIYIFLSNRVNPTRNNKAFTSCNPRYNILQAAYSN